MISSVSKTSTLPRLYAVITDIRLPQRESLSLLTKTKDTALVLRKAYTDLTNVCPARTSRLQTRHGPQPCVSSEWWRSERWAFMVGRFCIFPVYWKHPEPVQLQYKKMINPTNFKVYSHWQNGAPAYTRYATPVWDRRYLFTRNVIVHLCNT